MVPVATPSSARSLYLHVPFCARKCEYCAFYSTSADGALIERYVAALIREVEARAETLPTPPTTVFFGGGTPSLLGLKQWERILGAFGRVGWLGAVEWTIESNPATVSADKARMLREAGVNRMSLGVQSLDPDLLDRLGRVHSREMVFRSYDVLRSAGFDNVNVDLMFAIPGQTLEIWKDTLREAVALGSEHLSCYEVIYEQDTPLFEQLRAGEFDVDEDLAASMFETLVEAAGAAGYGQYEVANFARPDRECRHNVNYWRGGAYAAFGPSASGFEGGVRYRNVANTGLYCERVEAGGSPREWTEQLGPLARAGEIAAFGLRMNRGWPWEVFRGVTGFDLREQWGREIDELVARGWGVADAEGFRLTARGLRFADAAGSEFLTSDPGGGRSPGAMLAFARGSDAASGAERARS